MPGSDVSPGELEGKKRTMKGWSGQGFAEQTPEGEESGSRAGAWISPED